uniref:C2H2-type domain-containing protein n=1 Tax=Takifugu rubripes TaxID=31033 RepID=H2U2C4_TAKRU
SSSLNCPGNTPADEESNPEELEDLEIKGEEEELHASQTCEQLVVKLEDDTFIYTPAYEESDHSDSEPSERPQSRSKDAFPCNVSEVYHHVHKPYSCNVCGKGFSQTSDLKNHTRTHLNERQFSCDTCGKAFTHPKVLNSHLRIHTGEKPYTCTTCGEKFRFSNALKVHIRRNHTGERPYLCKTCGKTFIDMSKLKVHIRTHTGEKPYLCKVCGKAFIEMSRLNVHMRTHTGEKPYQCKFCGKGFIETSKMNVHMRIHTEMLTSQNCYNFYPCFLPS